MINIKAYEEKPQRELKVKLRNLKLHNIFVVLMLLYASETWIVRENKWKNV
jgi:hypothetical protein